MKKRYILFGIILMLSCLLLIIGISVIQTGKKPVIEQAANNTYDRTITVVSDVYFQPYTFIDSESRISGFDVELMNYLSNKINVNVKYRLLSWEECLEAIKNGEADVITGLGYSPDNNSFAHLLPALGEDPFVCFGVDSFTDLSELRNKRLATLTGVGVINDFIVPYQLSDNLTTYDSYTEVLKSVISGENDYGIVRYSVGRRILADLNHTEIKFVGPTLSLTPLTIGVTRNDEALAKELTAALNHYIEDGTVARLSEKWLQDYIDLIRITDILTHYRTVIIFIAILFLILGFLFMIHITKLKERAAVTRFDEATRTFEYQRLLADATKGLYEDIYELDMTHRCAVGEETKNFFGRLGLPPDHPYNDALITIAEKTIKKEYHDTYLRTFNSTSVIEAYDNGVRSLSCDLEILRQDGQYYWVSINGRIFYWQEDDSIRLITYRRNIDEQKKRESQLLDEATIDSLTGIRNRASTEQGIEMLLRQSSDMERHLLIMIDIDYFKEVNDTFGHDYGDNVLLSSARLIQDLFRSDDIVGRIGGDEFMVLMKHARNDEIITEKLNALNACLSREISNGNKHLHVSASIGAAIFPSDGMTLKDLYQNADSALYTVKAAGRNGNARFEKQIKDSSIANSRDISETSSDKSG